MADDYLDRAERLLKQHEIETFRIEHRRKHRAIVVSTGGKEYTVIIPSTGSDQRGPAAMVSDLRRLLGLRRVRVASETHAPRACKPKHRVQRRDRVTPSSPLLDEPARMPDKFYGPLERLRAQFAAEPARPPAAECLDAMPAAPAARLRTPWLGRHVRYLEA
jgi:hypothetical protein